MITINDINNDYARSILCKKLAKKEYELKERGRKFFLRNKKEIRESIDEYSILNQKDRTRYLLTHRMYHVYETYERMKGDIKRELYRAQQASVFRDKSKCYAIVSNSESGITILHELTEGASLDISSIDDDKELYLVDQISRYDRFIGYLTSKKLEEAKKIARATLTYEDDADEKTRNQLVGKLIRELKSKQ